MNVFDSHVLRNTGFSSSIEDYEHNAATENVYFPAGRSSTAHVFITAQSLPSASFGNRHIFLKFIAPGTSDFIIDHGTGELVERAGYLAFGAPESDYRPSRWGDFREDLRYTDHFDNAEVGLIYFGERYYSPTLNRWISRDPLVVGGAVGEADPFVFVNDSPIRYVDPFGLDGCDSSSLGCDPSQQGLWGAISGAWDWVSGHVGGGGRSSRSGASGGGSSAAPPPPPQRPPPSITYTPSSTGGDAPVIVGAPSTSTPSGQADTGPSVSEYQETFLVDYNHCNPDDPSGVSCTYSTTKLIELSSYCELNPSGACAASISEDRLKTAVIAGEVAATSVLGPLAAGVELAVAESILPSTLARVIPRGIEATTLGRVGATDVFVTVPEDIAGMNAAQIAQRLTIAESPTGYQILQFPTPAEGLASPVFRTELGFVGRGYTAGGAREFVIPNGPIPPGTTIRTVP